MRIEPATSAHAEAIAAIYDEAARTTPATFDNEGHPPAWWADAIETGGYKGRSRVLPKPELRQLIVELLRRLRKSPLFERSQSAVVKLTVVHRGASFGFEELEQF